MSARASYALLRERKRCASYVRRRAKIKEVLRECMSFDIGLDQSFVIYSSLFAIMWVLEKKTKTEKYSNRKETHTDTYMDNRIRRKSGGKQS